MLLIVLSAGTLVVREGLFELLVCELLWHILMLLPKLSTLLCKPRVSKAVHLKEF